MPFCGPKIGEYLELVVTITLEKVLWAIEFVKIGYWAPKEQNSSPVAKLTLRVQNQKSRFISAIMTLYKIVFFYHANGHIPEISKINFVPHFISCSRYVVVVVNIFILV